MAGFMTLYSMSHETIWLVLDDTANNLQGSVNVSS